MGVRGGGRGGERRCGEEEGGEGGKEGGRRRGKRRGVVKQVCELRVPKPRLIDDELKIKWKETAEPVCLLWSGCLCRRSQRRCGV